MRCVQRTLESWPHTETVVGRDVIGVIDDVTLAGRLSRGIAEQRLGVAILMMPLGLADVVRADLLCVVAAPPSAEVGRALRKHRSAGIVTIELSGDAGSGIGAVDRNGLRVRLPRRAATQVILWAAGALDRPPGVRLSEREHAAVGLYIVGNSLTAVSQTLGVGIETVRTLLRRARAKFTAAGYACSSRAELAQAVRDASAEWS